MKNKSETPKAHKRDREQHSGHTPAKPTSKPGQRKADLRPSRSAAPAPSEINKPGRKTNHSKPFGRKPAPGTDRAADAATTGRGAADALATPGKKRHSPLPASPLRGEERGRHGVKGAAAEGKPKFPQSRGTGTYGASPLAKAGGAKAKTKPGASGAADKAPARAPRAKGEEYRPTLRSGQTLELQVLSTNDDGFGVATHEGNRVLVAGALPGEVLVAKVTYVGRREAFANSLRIVKASPDRQPAPACGMGRACDGCPLIQMRYPAQLAWKKNLVAKELRKFPSLAEAEIHDTIASPKELNYRNTAKLVVAGKHSDPVIGIYRRNSHDVLEIEDCPLHHPLINKVVKAAKAGIKKGKVPIYNPKSEMGLLRYLVVRVAEPSDKVMVVFVTSDQGYNEMHHLAKFVQQAVPEVAVVAQNINTSTGNVIFGQKDRFLTKAQTLRAYVGEKSFHLSPHSFFQVNSGAARIIYEKVRELAALKGSERVIDVYCGIGGISLYLADKAREVVGIEFVEAAVADATENAALNRAENCSFEAGDAVHLIDEIGEEGGADLIVLNPPRKGCDEKVLRSVAAIEPARIIYVSCSPETLARDLDILSRLGYRTREVYPVDMFPQTVHVEDVVLLERKGA